MKRIDSILSSWEDYELIDSGEGRKLERFGDIVLDRPDPQALWNKRNPREWNNADAQFLWADKGERWKSTPKTPEEWNVSYGPIKMILGLKGFKHVGIFPEHAPQWDEIIALGRKKNNLRMLNLFGYTGAASIAGALGGMQVTHVDASKTTIATVKENVRQSGLKSDAIRTVCEDALRYAKRLVNRGEQFEVIVMDPPAFGRGPKGEVWKIEESLHELLTLLPRLLSSEAELVILNGYSAGYSARTFGELLTEAVPSGSVLYGDIGIIEGEATRVLSTGIYAKWQR